jgi:hypothetical protein
MTGFKNYGPGVSQNPQDISIGGAFSADERSYESVVIQNDQPLIDWELNLRADVGSALRQSALASDFPTCFLDGDFLESANPSYGGSYSFLSAIVGNENKFQLKASNAVVNGWPIRFEYSETPTPGQNVISLTAPPVAGVRTDLVILEVWRAVVSAIPNVAHKSATGLILRNGNVKAPDAVNLADDLIDPVYAVESALRVQIQYRFRVINNVDTAGFPNGLDDPSVFAFSASDFSGPGADGAVTAFNYVKSPTDGGLWIAGNGNAASATTLGTLDGFMYATPICAVFRRNTTAFSRTVNLNGATLIASAVSSRPDGFFADQIAAQDIRDMRRGCARDLREVLEKATQQVFDNTLATNQQTLSGVTGTTLFCKDDIGLGASLGNPDAVRRTYSDRSVTESIVVQVDIGGLPQLSATFTLSALRLPWDAFNTNLLAVAPAGTNILSITQIRRVNGATDIDFIAAGFVSSIVLSTNITGIDQAQIFFTTPLSSQTLYVEILLEYPFNRGLTRNMVDFLGVWAPPPAFIAPWVDATEFTATSDPNRFLMSAIQIKGDVAHRETLVRIQTIAQSRSFFAIDINLLMIWERLNGDPITITDGINAPYVTTNYTVNTSYTLVTLSGGAPVPANTSVTVNYQSFRPAPPVVAAPADSYQVYYRSAAIQSITPPAGTQTLTLIPRLVDQNLYVITASTGSPDNSFPYFAPSEQLAIGALPTPDYPEAILDGPGQISTLGFDVDSGFLRLPLVIPYTPNPTQVQLFKDAPDAVQDAEGRNFWPKSQNPASSPQFYSPVLFSIQLSLPQNHKIAVPVLMELKTDFDSIGRKGTLVLVVFTSWQFYTKENKIEFSSSLSVSAASVYRVTGNLLNTRRNNA